MAVISLGGAFGDTLDEFEASCKLAAAFDVEILGSSALLVLWRQVTGSDTQQVQRCPSIHLAFQDLQAIDLPFSLAITPGQFQSRPYSIYVHLDAPGKVPHSFYGTR
jgi:hypothetical protein